MTDWRPIQRRLGVKDDGVLGPLTYAAMFRRCSCTDFKLASIMGQQAALSFPAAGIDTPIRIAHWLAQAAHETGGFRWMRERGSGDKNGDGLDDYLIYLDRRTDLGNTPEIDGDGEKFRGRGIPHLTGHDNYLKAGIALGLDLVNDPDLAARGDVAVRIGVWFWTRARLNLAADRDDIVTVTKGINGGLIGLADRRNWLRSIREWCA